MEPTALATPDSPTTPTTDPTASATPAETTLGSARVSRRPPTQSDGATLEEAAARFANDAQAHGDNRPWNQIYEEILADFRSQGTCSGAAQQQQQQQQQFGVPSQRPAPGPQDPGSAGLNLGGLVGIGSNGNTAIDLNPAKKREQILREQQQAQAAQKQQHQRPGLGFV